MWQVTNDNGLLQQGLTRLVPNYYVEKATEINFSYLSKQGIRCVALDIDNTLVPDGGVNVDDSTISFFREQREKGFIKTLAIATNRSQKRMGDIAQEMHADVAFHANGLKRKPFSSYFDDLLKQMGCTPEETLMVGDKVLQDIGGGNAAGLTTVLVDPLGPAMWLERMLFRFVRSQTDRVDIPPEPNSDVS